MSPFVLVHGAWGGGWYWRDVARKLRQAGHEVLTPTLTGLGERSHLGHPGVNPDTHIQDIVRLLHDEDLREVIPVGHSYAGMVITGVADVAAERLARLVYLDALPEHGQSRFDLQPGAGDRWEERAREGGGWRVDLDVPEEVLMDSIPGTGARRWYLERSQGQGHPPSGHCDSRCGRRTQRGERCHERFWGVPGMRWECAWGSTGVWRSGRRPIRG